MDTEEYIIPAPLHTTNVLDLSCEDSNTTVLHFNLTHPEDITVYEVQDANTPEEKDAKHKGNSCEGSDSGVEVLETPEAAPDICPLDKLERNLNSNYRPYEQVTPARSCESSLASCCSQYEELYNGTSEGGSESSLNISPRHGKRLTASATKKKDPTTESKTKPTKTKSKLPPQSKTPTSSASSISNTRKKVLLSETKAKNLTQNSRSDSRTQNSSKTPTTPSRAKSVERQQKTLFLSLNGKPTSARKTNYTTLPLNSSKKDKKIVKTPTDDGRWPSINSRPAPLMSRSSRGISSQEAGKSKVSELKTVDRYARDRSLDTLRNYRPKPAPKIKLYYETCVQTALSIRDIDNAFPEGKASLNDVEKTDKESQVDTWIVDEEKMKVNHEEVEKVDNETQVDLVYIDYEKLKNEHEDLITLHEKLNINFEEQQAKLTECERRLREEIAEKKSLKQELRQNTERIQAILANDSCPTEEGDSLLVLESKFQNVSEVIVRQENEISKLNASRRALQRDLNKSFTEQKRLLKQLYEQEIESGEMQEFLQAEKNTLTEALKEMENCLGEKSKELEKKQNDCDHLRLENVSLQARLSVFEGRCKELLVHQGSAASGAAVALSALISRLDGLVEELVASYKISEQELDDIVYHNEVYTNSSESPDVSPENAKSFPKDKTPSPTTRGSFISAIINAIKSATSQSPFSSNRDGSRDRLCGDGASVPDLLDSETEPCLMMEHVLEDVVIPDGHSHNMISSGHSMFSSLITRSESYEHVPRPLYSRQMSEPASLNILDSMNASYTSEMSTVSERSNSVSVVDQVIDVDNLITRLLKVIRIIQMDTDENMVLLQKRYEDLLEENALEKEARQDLEHQSKDWEKKACSLKQEVKKMQQQLTKKNAELSQQRSELEKLNHDVCELSTALSKTEADLKQKESTQDQTALETIEDLNEKLQCKESQLNKLSQDYEKNKEVLMANLKTAMAEAKKYYDTIDNALEVLHGLQSVIEEHPSLVQLQAELEEVNFQSASSSSFVLPPDCNANAALLQNISSPINTTA